MQFAVEVERGTGLKTKDSSGSQGSVGPELHRALVDVGGAAGVAAVSGKGSGNIAEQERSGPRLVETRVDLAADFERAGAGGKHVTKAGQRAAADRGVGFGEDATAVEGQSLNRRNRQDGRVDAHRAGAAVEGERIDRHRVRRERVGGQHDVRVGGPEIAENLGGSERPNRGGSRRVSGGETGARTGAGVEDGPRQDRLVGGVIAASLTGEGGRHVEVGR